MPEYLAPGVYVEEVSFRADSIGGVSTSIAGFVGPTLFGPPFGVPELLTSYSDFEHIYGGLDQIHFEDEGLSLNYMAQAVRAFFENGGQQLFVSRVFKSGDAESGPYTANSGIGCATASIDTLISPVGSIPLRARYPGQGGNISLTFTVHVSKNVLAGIPHDPTQPLGAQDPVLRGVGNFDSVWINKTSSPPATGVYWAENYLTTSHQWKWRFHGETVGDTIELTEGTGHLVPGVGGDEVRILTVSASVAFPGAFPRSTLYEGLTFHPSHPNSLSQFFGVELTSRSRSLTVPLVFDEDRQFGTGPLIASVMLTQQRTEVEKGRLKKLLGLPQSDTTTDLSILATLGNSQLADTDRQIQVTLGGGSDGNCPGPESYEGEDSDPTAKTGLKSFEDITHISMVAAPGHSAGGNDSETAKANMLTIANLLIVHCQQMRYRVALLDSADQQDLTEISLYRAQMDSEYAALYYPWVRIMDPVSDTEINLPPSGFVAGLCAENDRTTGVHKAPANMVVQLAISFEVLLNKAQQDLLNPEGINCFRYLEGRGYRLWGARTISSDSQWKYLNVRRFFCYLEQSIDIGTQPVVFEPNSEATWAKVVRSVSDFLYSEWQSGRLMGDKPEQAFFVRCDRSTMTQNDLDNGRLVCLIGVAPITPAEFVIFRIGQWVGQQQP